MNSLFPGIDEPPVCKFSADRRYRYTLCRRWKPGERYVQFIGLNPSTADETLDDPTIRRLIGFAKQLEFPALCMTNLFAFRATDPRDMQVAKDPVGPDNDAVLEQVARNAALIICCWGNGGTFLGRSSSVARMLRSAQCALNCFGTTKSGAPRHPLYLPNSAAVSRFCA